MGLGDCPKCWDGICSCGYQYKHFKWKDIVYFVKGIIKYKLGLNK